jgi:hypothetical protein
MFAKTTPASSALSFPTTPNVGTGLCPVLHLLPFFRNKQGRLCVDVCIIIGKIA